jgi:sugar phosphate isomerase/epimerase
MTATASQKKVKLKNSFCTIAYKNSQVPLPEILQHLSSCGYDGAELWWPHVEKLSKSQLEETKALLKKLNLVIPMISPYLGNFNLPMTNRDEMLDRVRVAAPVAVALGSPLLRMFAGWTCETSSLTASPEYWKYNLDGYREMAKIVKDHGLHLALETHDETLADSIDGINRILEAGMGRIKINLQPDEIGKNSGLAKKVDVYRKLKEHVVHAHLRPFFEDEQEKTEWAELFAEFQKNQFKGFVSIEHCSAKDDPAATAKLGQEVIRGLSGQI